MSDLTILIPALNEEDAIAVTINGLLSVAGTIVSKLEIIVVDDGSNDGTAEIIDGLAAANPQIRALHNATNQGLGYIFELGIAQAQYSSLLYIPGDNAYDVEGLKPLFNAVGSADLIVGYRINQSQARPFHRVIISRLYTLIMNAIFRTRMKDFHGAIVYPIHSVRQLRLINSVSHVEVIIKLLRRNVTLVQVPVLLNPNKGGVSRSLRWKSFLNILRMLRHLLFERA